MKRLKNSSHIAHELRHVVKRASKITILSVDEQPNGFVCTKLLIHRHDGHPLEHLTFTEPGVWTEDYVAGLLSAARHATIPASRPMPSWTFFFPKDVREAMFREWLEERDLHRACGRGRLFIGATLVCQLAVAAAIAMKDAIVDSIARILHPQGPGGA